MPPWLSQNAVPLAIVAAGLILWLRLRTRATPLAGDDPLAALLGNQEPVVVEVFDNG
jgi:hypothetical protein